MRKEIKIPIHKNNYLKFKSWIDLKRNCYHEYDDRVINSIYYDTENLQSAQDNLAGISERKKYRVRWYNKDKENLTFEIKIKRNNLGKKISFKTNSDFKDINKFFSCTNRLFKNENARFLVENINHFDLKPIMKISYTRSYYIFNKRIRITFDRDLKYHLLNNYNLSGEKFFDNMCVIEFKFNEKDNNLAQEILQNSIFVPKRFSKYLRSLFLAGKSIYI